MSTPTTLLEWLIAQGIDPATQPIQDASGLTEEEAIKNRGNDGIIILPLAQGGGRKTAWLTATSGK